MGYENMKDLYGLFLGVFFIGAGIFMMYNNEHVSVSTSIITLIPIGCGILIISITTVEYFNDRTKKSSEEQSEKTI